MSIPGASRQRDAVDEERAEPLTDGQPVEMEPTGRVERSELHSITWIEIRIRINCDPITRDTNGER